MADNPNKELNGAQRAIASLVSIVSSVPMIAGTCLIMIVISEVISVLPLNVQIGNIELKIGLFLQIIGFILLILFLERFQNVLSWVNREREKPITRDKLLVNGIVFNLTGLVIQFLNT